MFTKLKKAVKNVLVVLTVALATVRMKNMVLADAVAVQAVANHPIAIVNKPSQFFSHNEGDKDKSLSLLFIYRVIYQAINLNIKREEYKEG